MTRFWGREVPLSDGRLARTPSPQPNPEEAAIANQEGEPPEPKDRPTLSAELKSIMLHFMPPEEAFLLEAHYVLGQNQMAIAERLKTTQQSVQYRLQRALTRVRWALTLETWNRSSETMREHLAPLDRELVEFAIILWQNKWNQSKTAKAMGGTQSMVRISIMRLYHNLIHRSSDSDVEPYMRDLMKVIEERGWNTGSEQVQEPRAIKFPKFPKRKRKK